MKKVRNHRLICLLMAISVMIFGIYLEKIPVNSYFSCKQADVISSSDGMLEKVTAYKAETLSQRVLSLIQSAKREVKRSSFREGNRMMEVCVPKEGSLSQNFHSYVWRAEDKVYGGTSCSLAISNYIHKQDGEKA